MFWNIGITRKNMVKVYLMLGILASAMLLPSILITPQVPRVRIDELLLFGAIAINTVYFFANYFTRGEWTKAAVAEELKSERTLNRVFLLLLGSFIVSNLYGALVLKTSFGLRDLMELVTFGKYYLIITLVISVDATHREYKILKSGLLVLCTLILLVSWGQFWNIANINSWLTPILAPSHLNNLVDANPPRVLGTFDNPNVFGMFSVILISLTASVYYFKEPDLKLSLVPLVLTALSIKLAMMTISRTALLGTAVVLTFLSLSALYKHCWKREIMWKVGVLFLLTVLLTLTSPENFASRMSEGLNIGTSTSGQGHLQRSLEAIKVIKHSPILGWGTAKTTMTTLVDNEYLLFIRRYGIVGLGIYLWFFIKPFKIALRRSDGRDTESLIAIAFTAATAGVLIYNLTAGILYNLQLMTIFAAFMGFIYNMESKRV
jgi:hypothetical protein